MQMTKTFHAEDAQAWRAWLEAHHASETEIWLVFFKQHTGQRSIRYQEALEDALCFGWIDGVRQRIDEARFAQRFTPRRQPSHWSETNRKLAARLSREGRMTPAGLAVADFPRPDPEAPCPMRKDLPLPEWLETALRNDSLAWANFQGLPPSHQRRYLAWISAAKREETRQRRLQEALLLLRENKRIGLGPGEVRK